MMQEPPARVVYWRRVLRLTWGLLAAWLLVTLGGPWFARDLSAWHVGGYPLSYWLASQGALGLYLLIVVFHVLVMDRLDRALLEAESPVPGDDAQA